MTPCDYALDSGFAALLAMHGEPLSHLPPTEALTAEWGEAVTNEDGQAIESGNTSATSVIGIFDQDYLSESPETVGMAMNGPAVIIRGTDLPDVKRNSIIRRADGSTYYVQNVKVEGICKVLILTQHIH